MNVHGRRIRGRRSADAKKSAAWWDEAVHSTLRVHGDAMNEVKNSIMEVIRQNAIINKRRRMSDGES